MAGGSINYVSEVKRMLQPLGPYIIVILLMISLELRGTGP